MQLANPHARDHRSNRPIGPTDVVGCLRFQVPGIEVAWSAAQKDKDARLLGSDTTKSLFGIDACCNHPRQAHRQGTDAPGLEKLAARDQSGGLWSGSEFMLHRDFPGGRGVAGLTSLWLTMVLSFEHPLRPLLQIGAARSRTGGGYQQTERATGQECVTN